MKREFLKNLGIADDQIDKIMAEYGKDLQTEKDKAKAASTELETYMAKVAGLGKAAVDFVPDLFSQAQQLLQGSSFLTSNF